MIAAVAILGQSLRPPAFKVSAGQIIKSETAPLGKSFLIEAFLQLHPMAAHLNNGLVEVILVECPARGQSTGRREPGALVLALQTELVLAKEQPGVDHRPEQSSL